MPREVTRMLWLEAHNRHSRELEGSHVPTMLGECVVVRVPAVDQPAVAELDEHAGHLEGTKRWSHYDDGRENLF